MPHRYYFYKSTDPFIGGNSNGYSSNYRLVNVCNKLDRLRLNGCLVISKSRVIPINSAIQTFTQAVQIIKQNSEYSEIMGYSWKKCDRKAGLNGVGMDVLQEPGMFRLFFEEDKPLHMSSISTTPDELFWKESAFFEFDKSVPLKEQGLIYESLSDGSVSPEQIKHCLTDFSKKLLAYEFKAGIVKTENIEKAKEVYINERGLHS